MRTLVQWGEGREVFWDVVPFVSTQGVADVCVKAGGGELQHAALTDRELGDGVEKPHRLQVVDVVLQLCYAHPHQPKGLLDVTQPGVCPPICRRKKNKNIKRMWMHACRKGPTAPPGGPAAPPGEPTMIPEEPTATPDMKIT